MLIGGAGLSLIAVLLLEHEGRVAMAGNSSPGDIRDDTRFNTFLRYLSFGGLFIGLSVFQIEYDFGVEQFRLVLQPMMIAGAAALAAVAARLVLGPGAALIAAVLAIVLRGAVSLAVGPVLGAPHSWWALYLGPALVVELVALTPLVKRPLVFGAVSGLAVATVGLWLESLWIGAVYTYPWPTSMWGEALAMSIPVAVGMGLCGALLALVLTSSRLPRPAVGISIVVATVLAIGGAVANGLRIEVPENATATIALTDAAGTGEQRMVDADVRITPADLISDDPEWVSLLSWQGGLDNQRGLLVNHLERVGPGHYRTTQPMPVSGSWKTLLRVQDGTTMAGVPIYLPADPGIGAEEQPAEAVSTREFVPEITILQRERNLDHPSWLFGAASLVVLVCTLLLIAALTWGAGRVNARELAAGSTTDENRPVQPQT